MPGFLQKYSNNKENGIYETINLLTFLHNVN